MGKVNIVARGLSVLQKATLDFAYKRRLERLERPPSRCGLSEFDFIPAHIVNYYYGFLGTYPWVSDGIVTGGNSFRTKGYSFRIWNNTLEYYRKTRRFKCLKKNTLL